MGMRPVCFVSRRLDRETASVVIGIHDHGFTDVGEVVRAVRLVGGFTCFAEGRHEHGGEDGDDADDDEQFN